MTDIVIGGRRFTPQRNLRNVAMAVILGLVCLLVAYFIYGRVVSYVEPDGSVPGTALYMDGEATPALGPRLVFGASSLSHAGNLMILRLAGAPGELGAAHGRLLGSAVVAPSAGLAPVIEHTVPGSGLFNRMTYDLRMRWRYRFLDDGIPGHQLVELAGLLRGALVSAGAAPDYESFVRQQAALDVGVPAPWSAGAALRAVSRSLSFVTTLRGTSGDRLLVGRSFALVGAGDGGDAAAEQLTLQLVKAKDVIPFASLGWPGLVGVVSGINAEGIAVMLHPVHTSDVKTTRGAQPVALLARDVLENARTLKDAISILEHASPLGAASFLVVDGNTREWAVVERTPTRFEVRRNDLTVVTDLLTAKAFDDDPENDRAARSRPATMRAQRVRKLLQQRPAELADVAAILRDHRSESGTPLPPGHRGAVRDLGAVHAAVFDASAMVVWVADGPDAGARLRAFDLRYELRGEGARPVPPADVPADADYDPAVARQVRMALRHLRQARRHWQAGHPRQARELAQRALSHVPDLPEALKLAGDLARAQDDREEAERYYRRYLEIGPDDLGAEEEVRALLGHP